MIMINLSNIAKSFYALIRLFFSSVHMEVYRKSEMETLFLHLRIASGDVQGDVNNSL